MSDHPGSSLIGRRVGVYRVVALLGMGGMGEVYRAHDTRLGRDVALKVLPPAFTADTDRLARLEREAHALAALNHPNVATIHGVEDMASEPAGSTTVRALVLELVEGETLAERIDRTSLERPSRGLPVDEALAIARQIVDALDAAHEKGVVHRDLKPANIKITPDGIVKVLDFGLAKAAARGDAGDVPVNASTLVAATREGVVVGTTAYMSPEQARGQPVDKRTDIWAFGCVLYEVLCGRAAFARDTITDTVAAVLEREPDWGSLPASTPAAVRRLLRHCLEKNPKQRLRDIADARRDLDESAIAASEERAVATPAMLQRRAVSLALVVAAVVALAGAVLWTTSALDAPPRSMPISRTTVLLPPSYELDTRGGAAPMAISPDGRRLAYVLQGEGQTRLYVRSLDGFEASPIAGTEGAQYPFFSPDGEWVAFFADRRLKKVSTRGGSPLTICDAPTIGRGAAWAPDGTIVFDPGESGLMRVAAAGGAPEPITSRDPALDRNNLSWPHFLPDGRTLLLTLNEQSTPDAELATLSLSTGEWRRLGPGSQAQFLPSGHIIYHAVGVREGELHAAAFDPETLTLAGTPAAVIDNVFRAQDGGGTYFAVARNGTLIYAPGGYARTLVRVDRHGRRTPLSEERRGYRHPDISPDGLKIAVTVDPRPSQIWVYDIARRSWTPLATEQHNIAPVWTRDGRRVIFSSGADLYWRAADASGPADLLLARPRAQYASGLSHDGQSLLFANSDRAGNYDVWILPFGEEPRPLIQSQHNEAAARWSPDGRWLAYHSDDTGSYQVYVRRFPEIDKGRWTISTSGGRHPVWSPDGRELFYAIGSSVMSVRVEAPGDTFVAGTPELLFSGPFDLQTTDFAVSPDGTHFVMVEADPASRPTQVNVVLNWTEEVRSLVPAAR